ncbi:Do family serine endopeptidase [Hahella sp. SMD15-11]|uniref:Probable periplasmic serine endoprotease DegP-like n=1 Tax=Thermohahella caldifontis TaxID=3142973 RepID=A0AB39V0I2_9GAMM
MMRILFLIGSLLLAGLHASARELPDFTVLVEQVSPAVVNISTQADLSQLDGSPGEILKHFFGRPDPDTPPALPSTGSGFIVSEEGVILTNLHVVEGARRITVRLSDRREFEAKLLGKDKRSDLAVLRIEGHHLPVVRIGKSDTLKVGEWVLAIGSPFGFEHSVTAGIVSALGRALPNENYIPFIQTDVAINPGNSGGPLFNLNGEVVGINSQIYTRSGGFMGVSFAIPVDVAMKVVQQLQTEGVVRRGWLGVVIDDLSAEEARSLGMSRPQGASVRSVLKGSPAATAGLREGDVILALNGQEVMRSNELPPLVGGQAPGDQVELTVWRDGKESRVTLTLGELEGDAVVADGAGMHGLELVALDAKALEALGLSRGVRVAAIETGSALSGVLAPDDVLISLDGQPLTSPDDWNQYYRPDRQQWVRIYRAGQLFFAVMPGAGAQDGAESGD